MKTEKKEAHWTELKFLCTQQLFQAGFLFCFAVCLVGLFGGGQEARSHEKRVNNKQWELPQACIQHSH